MTKDTVHHIPICPFSQRLEILLSLKGRSDQIRFEVVDITRPRSEHLLRMTRGTTALPILETADGRIVKESLVILQYLEDLLPERPIAQRDPNRRAVENMKGAGNGALLPGRSTSSFVFEPDWRVRPWPPRNKYTHSATDAELGL